MNHFEENYRTQQCDITQPDLVSISLHPIILTTTFQLFSFLLMMVM